MSKEKAVAQKEHKRHEEKINWLFHWNSIKIKTGLKDEVSFEDKKKAIKAYVRGWLELINDEEKKNFKLKEFDIRRKNGSDSDFIVKAYLQPSVTEKPHDDDDESGGNHLIPPPPPPPDDSFS